MDILQEQNNLITNLIPDIVARVDSKKCYTWLNRAGIDFFGQDAIGKEASYYFEGEQDTYKKVAPMFEGKEGVYYIESWQRRQDGEKRLLSWWSRAIKDEKGKVIGVISIARDITDQYNLEAKNRQNEMQLNNALRLAHLGPWEYDILKDEFTFNDAFYSIFKTTAKEVGGYNMSSLEYAKRFVHPDDARLVGEEVEKTIKNKEDYFTRQLEHRIIYAGGETGYLEVCFFAIKDMNGNTVKTYGINQDITEFKMREESLKKIKNELQAKVKELQKYNKLTTDRELRMIELKKRIDELETIVAKYEKNSERPA